MKLAIVVLVMALLVSYTTAMGLWTNFMRRRGKEMIFSGDDNWKFWADRLISDYELSWPHLWPGHWYHTWIRWRS